MNKKFIYLFIIEKGAINTIDPYMITYCKNTFRSLTLHELHPAPYPPIKPTSLPVHPLVLS